MSNISQAALDTELDDFLAGLDAEISGGTAEPEVVKTPAPVAEVKKVAKAVAKTVEVVDPPAVTEIPDASVEDDLVQALEAELADVPVVDAAELEQQAALKAKVECETQKVAQIAAEAEKLELVRQKLAAATPATKETKVVESSDGSALKTYIDTDELKRDVAINPTDLDNNMIQHASLYVHYATQTVNARRQYDRIKNAVEILEATLDAEYRNKAADEGKKTTEAQLKNAVVSDKRCASAQVKLIEAHSIWKLADIAERAMDQRKDMLLEVARDRRKEKEGQTRVLELKAQKEMYLDQQRGARAA